MLTGVLVVVACGGGPEQAVPAPALPSGVIVAHQGPDVPAGWTVCDGRVTPSGLQTPDLRDRFILGTVPSDRDLRRDGGSATHVHEASTGRGDGSIGIDYDDSPSAASPGHIHTVEVQEASNLPPHVKLLYIMKD